MLTIEEKIARSEHFAKLCEQAVIPEWQEDCEQLVAWLRELQERRKLEPQWIPVSERLPEDMQFVLLTVRRLKNEYNPGPFISVGYIGWNQQHWWCAHDGDCEISKVEVLAWMPLPEAYKPNK